MPIEVRNCPCQTCSQGPNSDTAEVHRALNLIMAHADEKQRRLIAAMEALKLGRGGIARVSEITGVDPKTIRRGLREVKTGKVVEDRVRQEGAGRPAVEKKRSGDLGGSGRTRQR